MTVQSSAGWISALLNADPGAEHSDKVQVFERALKRERLARQKAELILETKSRELYLANEDLTLKNEQIIRRNQEIEETNAALMNTQAQLVQSEKMASVGQLAAGVAHEINNPIGYITSNLGTMQAYTDIMRTLISEYRQYSASVEAGDPDKSIYENIQTIQAKEDIDFVLDDVVELVSDSLSGAVRVKDIVLGLKSFSRVDSAEISEADIHAGIESTLKVLASELKYNCDVKLKFGDLPLVPCNLARINQVLLNLIINASHAIEGKGTITISTYQDDNWACITIKDTGCGISEEHIGSIFDPFFTTKPVGSGTGLGLSISYGIIEEHGGKLSAESEPGVGTQFTVRLPISSKQE